MCNDKIDGVSREEKASLLDAAQPEHLTVIDRRADAQERPASAPLVRTTPADLLQMAVGQGADLDRLERLMDLQQRWEDGEARKAFTRAMAAFKGQCPPVLNKDATVDFTSSKGRTHYRHATLGGILAVITPHLSRHGLSVSWEPSQAEKGFVEMTCVVTHEAGHSERRTMHGPRDASGNKNPLQEVGSTATYLQRYTLTAALGLSTGELDDDGGAGANNPPQQRPTQSKPAPKPAPKNTSGPNHDANVGGKSDSAQVKPTRESQQEKLPDWVVKCLPACKALGILQTDLEGPQGLGKPASTWNETEDKKAVSETYRAIQAMPPADRPAEIDRLFTREPGQDDDEVTP